MNYWFVDPANIAECFLPFSEWLYSIAPVRRDATKHTFNVRDWATYHWVPGDAAWLAQNLWDHYAFSQDTTHIEASKVLGVEEEFRTEVDGIRARLLGRQRCRWMPVAMDRPAGAEPDKSPSKRGFTTENVPTRSSTA
jgi:hypothetical protein